MPPRERSIATACVLAATLVVGPTPAPVRADEGAHGLASPRLAAGHAVAGSDAARGRDSAAPEPEWGLDLVATTLLPLTVGGMMIVEMPGGIQVRVGAGVVVPVFVDGINDVGAAWSLWDDQTSSALSELLVDALVLEAALGIRPGRGPLELSVGYVLFWSECPAPRLASLEATALSVSAYAIHAELGVRAPVGDWVVFRVAVGWLHTLAQSVVAGMRDPSAPESEAVQAFVESTIGGWVMAYGLGPTLSASIGIHFQ